MSHDSFQNGDGKDDNYKWPVTSVTVSILVVWIFISWFIQSPGYEPWAGILASLLALVILWRIHPHRNAYVIDIGIATLFIFAHLIIFPSIQENDSDSIPSTPDSQIQDPVVIVSTIATDKIPETTIESTRVTEETGIPKRVARFDEKIIQDGMEVSESIALINGVFQNVSAEDELWIVAESGGNCYPMNGPVKRESSTGIWRHSGVTFPQSGESYLLSLVLADQENSIILWDAIGNQHGFFCASIDIEELETISVTVVDE